LTDELLDWNLQINAAKDNCEKSKPKAGEFDELAKSMCKKKWA